MPRDIFGGKPKGPAPEDIEREAQRELDRLTRAPVPGGGGMGAGFGGPAAPPSLGPQSPLEAMADGLSQRKRVRKKKGGLQTAEEKAAWSQGFAGPASITGSVGSTLDFGGGVAPGMMRRSPPPDAQPLKRRTTADDYDDDDDPDDDLFATELALRDHAERFGKNLEDMVIRSDPAEAEAMRAAAMQRFMQRTPPSADSPSEGGFTPPTRLNLRRRGRLRQVEDDEPNPGPEDELDDELQDEPDTGELQQIEQELEAEAAAAHQAEADAGVPQFGLMVDERARLAERRAELAEERASLAEARAQAAEIELAMAAELVADYERRLSELEHGQVEQVQVEDEDEEEEEVVPAPKRAAAAKARARKKAPAAKKAGAKKAAATKRKPPAKDAPAPKKTARQRTPPPPRDDDEAPALGGALGRRLAQKKTAARTR